MFTTAATLSPPRPARHDAASRAFAGSKHLAQLHERTHDFDVDHDGALAAQDAG